MVDKAERVRDHEINSFRIKPEIILHGSASFTDAHVQDEVPKLVWTGTPRAFSNLPDFSAILTKRLRRCQKRNRNLGVEKSSAIRKIWRHTYDILFPSEQTLGIKQLQHKVKRTRSDVQRYLGLTWIGICELLPDEDLCMVELMRLWREFRSFLVVLQGVLLNLEKILRIWAKILYLVLFSLSFSEFFNRIRPPCTTMPWTIWPALVVLWGVCWMFYDSVGGNLWEQDEFPIIDINWQFDDSDAFPDVDLNFNNLINGVSTLNALNFDLTNFEQQPQLLAPNLDSTVSLGTFQNYMPTLLTANPTSTTSPRAIKPGNDRISDNQDLGMSVIDGEPRSPETQREGTASTDSQSFITPLAHERPEGGQTRSSRSSRHGKTEKYLCPYLNCKHSQLGSGFKRKDHLDQHLRGPHKETTVPRMRAKPTGAASKPSIPTSAREIPRPSPQPQKRKRSGEDETRRLTVEELREELGEERELRLTLKEENRSLRQRLELFEQRIKRMRNGSSEYT